MPLPAIVPAILSALGWIGIDLGISYLTRDTTDISYVSGLDFNQFIETYWLSLLLYLLMIASSVFLAIPKRSKDGAGFRF